MGDFLICDKEEGSIKTVFIDDQLYDKCVFKNGVWTPVCIHETCEEYPKERHLCRKHLKEENSIPEGMIIQKGSINYIKTGIKWVPVCKICKNASVKKTGYCLEHSNYKNTGETMGSIVDIMRDFGM